MRQNDMCFSAEYNMDASVEFQEGILKAKVLGIPIDIILHARLAIEARHVSSICIVVISKVTTVIDAHHAAANVATASDTHL